MSIQTKKGKHFSGRRLGRMVGKLNNFLVHRFRLDPWKTYPAYDYVQDVTVHRIHDFLGVDKQDVKRWVIAGGYLGLEIPAILENYPACVVDVFECSERYIGPLKRTFALESRVSVQPIALSDKKGQATFFETTLEGSGSLLPLGDLHRDLFRSQAAEEFSVQAERLDDIEGDRGQIDVLQIDVQGAELSVLRGAIESLRKTRAVFIELSVDAGLYAQGSTASEVRALLEQEGFVLALLGLDFNRTGNGLFINSALVGGARRADR